MENLCFITTTEGTQESFIIPALYAFKQKGYEITVICTMSDRFLETFSKDFHCINVRMKRGISLKECLTKPFEFYRIFKTHRFDYVQYATTNASFYCCLAAKLLGIKTRVYCSWGLLYEGYAGIRRTLFKRIEKCLCDTATHITVASYKNLDVAAGDGVLDRRKASVIGDGGTVGVDLKEFDIESRDENREKVVREYPVLAGKTVFGYVGRIERDKGISELLCAFIKAGNPDYALLLVGNFDELRSEIEPELLSEARSMGNIIFHGFSREVPKYMSAMDILVHPTYREGFSMVIQQAMAMGAAIITTDVPGPSEVIEEGRSGLLVPDHNADELCKAMVRLGDDNELRKSFAEAGLDRVRRKFERNHMLQLTIENREKMMNREI